MSAVIMITALEVPLGTEKRQPGTSAPSVDLKGAANDKTWLMTMDSQQH